MSSSLWDLRNDFSIIHNPNGQWSYGECSANTFSLDTAMSSFGKQDGGAFFLGWGSLWKNFGSEDFGIRPAHMSFGSNAATPCAKWTAPMKNRYQVNIEIGGTTAVQQLGHGNVNARLATVLTKGVATPSNSFINNIMKFTFIADMQAGDDIVTSIGMNNNGAGNTHVSWSVSLLPPPPASVKFDLCAQDTFCKLGVYSGNASTVEECVDKCIYQNPSAVLIDYFSSASNNYCYCMAAGDMCTATANYAGYSVYSLRGTACPSQFPALPSVLNPTAAPSRRFRADLPPPPPGFIRVRRKRNRPAATAAAVVANQTQVAPVVMAQTSSQIIIPNSQRMKVYTIFNIPAGGALKYMNDIKSSFGFLDIIYITAKAQLNSIIFEPDSILFVQHLLETDIKAADILKVKASQNVKIVLTVHDTYWITDSPKNYFSEMQDISIHGASSKSQLTMDLSVTQLFKACNMIILPSQFMKGVYAVHYPSDNMVIVPHIDVVSTQVMENNPIISDNVINIGVLHSYSISKGKELVEHLRNRQKEILQHKIVFKIVGVNIPAYTETKGAFNKLLIDQHIHGLLYLSRYPETYSYALTKYLNSGLPILYNNIGSLKERIPLSDRFFTVYQTETEIDAVLMNKGDESRRSPFAKLHNRFAVFISHIISAAESHSYNFGAEQVVVPEFYKSLFAPQYWNHNLVLITSKLVVSSARTSVFSYEERLLQLQDTISTVRKHIPDSFIVLVDNSQLSDAVVALLAGKVDKFLNIVNDLPLNSFTDVSPNKALGEVAQLLAARKLFLQDIDLTLFKNIFKITGRYTINDSFDYGLFSSDSNVFKRSMQHAHAKHYYNCFYKIRPVDGKKYFSALRQILQGNDDVDQSRDLEELLPELLAYNFTEVSLLGITQYLSAERNPKSV